MSKLIITDKKYTVEEFMAFTAKEDLARYELADGDIYAMSSPSSNHQDIAGFIYSRFRDFFDKKKCKAYIAPLDVHLEADDRKNKSVFQPDVLVVCDANKIKRDGIHGAPDLVVEIVSPSSSATDYILKFKYYLKFKVKEYWIVDTEKILLFNLINDEYAATIFHFSSVVTSRLFPDLKIDFCQFDGEPPETE